MNIEFSKYHGLGNDYLFINEFSFSSIDPSLLPDLAARMSHRRLGIGSDGLVVVSPDPDVDARIRIFNADGSEAETCGNALRCVARILHETGIISESHSRISTINRIVDAWIINDSPNDFIVRIDMGKPDWNPESIPLSGQHQSMPFELTIQDRTFHACAVSMGNPHCVIYGTSFLESEVENLGPLIENHPMFPRRINVEFCHQKDPRCIEMKVWERGSGMTLACGSGACAAFAVSRALHQADREVKVHLPGGILSLAESSEGHIWMTGPAVYVFQGAYWMDL